MRGANGFTLVELLVAVALLAGGVMVVSTMSLTAQARVMRSGQKTSAGAAAQQRIEWLRNQPYGSSELNAGTTVQVLSGLYDGYRMTIRIADDTPAAGIKQVSVTTQTPAGRSVRLDTLIGERAP